MFEEGEPGKPRNWGWTIGIIILVCLINLGIFVLVRTLLDMSNEFDEPLIQGSVRDKLAVFLYVFATTFCFGCWCCFCCAGNCCEWVLFGCRWENRQRVAHWWTGVIHHKHGFVQRTLSRKNTIAKVLSKKSTVTPSEQYDSGYENRGCADMESQTNTSRFISARVHERSKVALEASPVADVDLARLEPGRRSSQWMEMRRPSTLPGKECTTVGVNTVDYYEIPVSLVTPQAVAILDPQFVADSRHEEDVERKKSVFESEEMVSLNGSSSSSPTDLPTTSNTTV